MSSFQFFVILAKVIVLLLHRIYLQLIFEWYWYIYRISLCFSLKLKNKYFYVFVFLFAWSEELLYYYCPQRLRKVSNTEYYVKNVRIRSFSGPYSVRMRKNMDQKNSEYRHLSRSESVEKSSILSLMKMINTDNFIMWRK